jgi:sugar lactone lactonase YvrE/Tol biopolymer transport system component
MDRARQYKLVLLAVTLLLIDILIGGCDLMGCGNGTINTGGTGPIGNADYIFIADQGNSRVVQIDDMTGHDWAAEGGVLQFMNPGKIHLDSAGRIYMAFSAGNMILRMDDMSGTNLMTLGTTGSSIKQFNHPSDVVVDTQGHIYVTDAGNGRIVRMNDMTGSGWMTLGTPGKSIGQFNNPEALCLDQSGRIYIADTGNGRIVRITYISGVGWTQNLPALKLLPQDIYVDGNNQIYIVNGNSAAGRSNVMRFTSPTDRTPRTFLPNSGPNISALYGVWVDSSNRIYLADSANNQILRVDDMNGSNPSTLDGKSSSAGRLVGPAGICLDSSGRFYISDTANERVVRFDDWNGTNAIALVPPLFQTHYANANGVYVDNQQGLFLADTSNNRIVHLRGIDVTIPTQGWIYSNLYEEFGTQGSGTNQFNQPQGIFLDAAGHIYIADTGNNRIVRMDTMSGGNWTALGTQGSGVKQLSSPTGIFVDLKNHIYVADTGNSRIVRVDDMTGTNWMTLTHSADSSQSLTHPEGVCLDGNGSIYVADTGNNRIVHVDDMTGRGWTTLGTRGSGTNQFISPVSILGDQNGTFYVTDSGNNRLIAINNIQGTRWLTLGTLGIGVNQFQHPVGVCPTNIQLGPSTGGAGSGTTSSFTLAVNPTSGTPTQGGAAATFTLTLASQQGFAGSVDLTVTGAPTGLTVTGPNPATVALSAAGNATSHFTVQASATAPSSAQLTVTAKSGSLTQAVTVPITVTSPSTGGGQIVFATYPTGGARNIAIMNANGSNLVQLTHDTSGTDNDPRFSPNGKQIVFSRSTTNGSTTSSSDIWLMHADGTGLIKVTPTFATGPTNTYNSHPSFSSDGQHILFLAFSLNIGTIQIALMDLDGSNAHTIGTGILPDMNSGPVFSPDGQTIAFVGRLSAGQDFESINEMNADGSNPHKVSNVAATSLHSLRFSKDGSHLVFEEVGYNQTTNNSTQNIYIMDASGNNVESVTSDDKSENPAFTSSGRIVFDSLESGQIVIMDANGSNKTALTHSASGVFNNSPDSQ